MNPRSLLFTLLAAISLFPPASAQRDAPGKGHGRLGVLAGTWDQEVRYGMPGGAVIQAQGTAEFRWVLGGRFLEGRATSGTGKARVESLRLLGFDQRLGKYTAVGFDTLGTYSVRARGDYDETTRTFTLRGEETDPASGMTQKFREVTRILDPDHLEFEIWFSFPGREEFRAVQVRSMRQKTSRAGPEAILEAQQTAWNRGDLEAFLAAGYERTTDLTFLSGGDWQRGYEEVLQRYRKTYASEGREMGRLAFSDLETVPLGPENVLVRGRWHLAFSDGSEKGGLFTLIFRRTPQGWRILHDHTSVAAQ